jgi:succinate dehydrogenase (ubiquinone) flavoprotein subunit
LNTGQSQPELPPNAGEKTIAWLDKLRYANGDLPTATIRNKMQRVMQNNAAVFRTQETLEEGRAWLAMMDSEFLDVHYIDTYFV